jgi:hypothetical protein
LKDVWLDEGARKLEKFSNEQQHFKGAIFKGK